MTHIVMGLVNYSAKITSDCVETTLLQNSKLISSSVQSHDVTGSTFVSTQEKIII